MYSYGIYLDTILQFFLAFSTLPDEDEGNKVSANDPGKILRPDFLIKELQKSWYRSLMDIKEADCLCCDILYRRYKVDDLFVLGESE